MGAGARGPGLPTSGAVALALGAGLGGGVADVLTGDGLRVAFAVAFIAGCALAAACVRRRGLAAAVVMPPLIYVAVALAAASLQGQTAGTSWLLSAVFETTTALMTGAPVLLLATLSAAGVALWRSVAHGEPLRRPHVPHRG